MNPVFSNTVVLPLQRPDFKPFLIQALLDWCEAQNYTPFMLVAVDDSVQVPERYVSEDRTIVLCVSSEATDKFSIADDELSFLTRFGDQIEQITVPLSRIAAVYPKENTDLVSYFEVQACTPSKRRRGAAEGEPETPVFRKV